MNTTADLRYTIVTSSRHPLSVKSLEFVTFCILIVHRRASPFLCHLLNPLFSLRKPKCTLYHIRQLPPKRPSHTFRLLSLQVNHSMQSYTLIISLTALRVTTLHSWTGRRISDRRGHRVYFKRKVDCSFLSHPGSAQIAIVYQVEWTNPSTTAIFLEFLFHLLFLCSYSSRHASIAPPSLQQLVHISSLSFSSLQQPPTLVFPPSLMIPQTP